LMFLLPDFIDGLLLYYESITIGCRRGIIAGSVVMHVAIFSFVVQIVYNNAIGIRNVDLLHNAVVVLYLDDLDEIIFEILQRFNPNWVEKLKAEIVTNSDLHEHDDDDDDDTLITQMEFKRELNNVKADIRHIRSVSGLDDLDEKIFDSIKRLNPKWVEKREAEISMNSERFGCKDDDDNDESIIQKSEMMEIKREKINLKTDVRHICSVSGTNLDDEMVNTEVLELKREIAKLKTELQNIHHILRKNLNIEGSMLNNNRIEPEKTHRFV